MSTSQAKFRKPVDLSISQSPAFSRWRPRFHFLPPYGWMNDPCGACYNPHSKRYHLAFQWNPADVEWANISWGSATSPDLLHWSISNEPSLVSETAYDCEGIFTGCVLSTKDGQMVGFYTSVSRLPIRFDLEYVRGSETLSMVSSGDGGLTWKRIISNPILSGPPLGIDVTGWRDPSVLAWPELDLILGKTRSLYGILSGGFKSEPVVGPTIFLYSIDPENVQCWTYVGSLLDIKKQTSLSRWSGNLGSNFEVCNFFTLRSGCPNVPDMNVVVCSAEGQDGSSRAVYWLSGALRLEDGKPKMSYEYGGFLDYGNFYAANSTYDPKNNERVLWGWINEDGLPLNRRKAQGWSGMLSLPRAVRMQIITNVTRARVSKLADITSIRVSSDSSGDSSTFTISTISSIPIEVTKLLRLPANKREISGDHRETIPLTTARWELDCSFAVDKTCKEVRVIIHSSGKPFITLSFIPLEETFSIRTRTVVDDNLNEVSTRFRTCPHTLFSYIDPNTGREVEEKLHLRAWFDTSVLEVFVNDRTAITERIYLDGSDVLDGMSFNVDDSDGQSVLERATLAVWDGLSL